MKLLVETIQGLQRENKDVMYSSLVKDTMKRKQPDVRRVELRVSHLPGPARGRREARSDRAARGSALRHLRRDRVRRQASSASRRAVRAPRQIRRTRRQVWGSTSRATSARVTRSPSSRRRRASSSSRSSARTPRSTPRPSSSWPRRASTTGPRSTASSPTSSSRAATPTRERARALPGIGRSRVQPRGRVQLPTAPRRHRRDGARAVTRTPPARQFYICLGTQSFLDGNYTVFGQVTEGLDVVHAIGAATSWRGDDRCSIERQEDSDLRPGADLLAVSEAPCDPGNVPLFERYPETRELPRVAARRVPDAGRDRCDGAGGGGGRGRTLDQARRPVRRSATAATRSASSSSCSRRRSPSGATDVITFGAAGSNHALATAIYGAGQGLKVHSMLIPQHNARYVRRNLRGSVAVGADLHHSRISDDMMRGTVRAAQAPARARGRRQPFVIPFGGTTPTSTAGFVNAALELADAGRSRGLLPEPDLVFVALGSMGTAAGLALGLRAAGMRTRVVAVPVVSRGPGDGRATCLDLARRAGRCCAARTRVPGLRVEPRRRRRRRRLPRRRGTRASRPRGWRRSELVDGRGGLHLEGTYTGKTLSALLAHGAERVRLEGSERPVLEHLQLAGPRPARRQADPARIPARLRCYFDGRCRSYDRRGLRPTPVLGWNAC